VRPAQVIAVGRDAGGITYSGNVETPTAKAEPPAPKPIKVRSKRAAEKRGWVFQLQQDPQMVRVSTDQRGVETWQKRPGRWSAEWVGSFKGGPPQAYRQYATSLEGLLKAIESFEQRKAGAR
jgi:hypothetical protein